MLVVRFDATAALWVCIGIVGCLGYACCLLCFADVMVCCLIWLCVPMLLVFLGIGFGDCALIGFDALLWFAFIWFCFHLVCLL